MRIATWNVNSLTVRLPHVLQWMAQAEIDILCLQETKVTDDKFPEQLIRDAGYEVVYAGQPTYNGVAALAKAPISDVVVGFPEWPDEQKRSLSMTVAGYRLINVYVPNGQSIGADKYDYKLNWLQQLQHWLASQIAENEALLLMGDFNIAPSDKDVHDPVLWRDKVLVSPAERAAFQSLLALGLHDSYLEKPGGDTPFSWWDYRQAAFRRNMGLRIDHICVTPAVLNQSKYCWIDKAPRGWERPSDHAPVVIELN